MRSPIVNRTVNRSRLRSPMSTRVRQQTTPKTNRPAPQRTTTTTTSKLLTKVETASSKSTTFTHSSLKITNKENNPGKKKKKAALDVKLTTEWSKKKRLSRRSIVKSNVLKPMNVQTEESEDIYSTDDRLSTPDDDLMVSSDRIPFSSSSITSPDSLECPGVSMIACDDDVQIVFR